MKQWSEEQFKEYYGMTRKELARVVANEIYLEKEKERIRELIDDVSDGQMILPKYCHTVQYLRKKKLSTVSLDRII